MQFTPSYLGTNSPDQATEQTLAEIRDKTNNLDVPLSSVSTSVTVTASPALTDAQLRATPVPVGGTFWQATQPVSIATAPVLVAGSATIGKVGIDQTVPGTTNAVQLSGGAADSTNSIISVVQKPLAVSTYSPSRFKNYGLNATLNVKSSSGNVFSVACINSNTSTRYLQLHNTATVPGAGGTAEYFFLIPSGAYVIVGTDFFTDMGINFSTGIAFAFSTTPGTYTAGSAADQATFIQYK